MAAYLEDPTFYHVSCRPYHVLAPPQPPPPPVPPLLHPLSHGYHPTPPSHYPAQRQEPPSCVAPSYNRYVPHTPSPRPFTPGYFVGTWSKDSFIDIIAFMLDAAAEVNNNFVPLPTYTQSESVYFSVSRPDIPTKDYVRRLVTYTRCSPSAFVVMLIYIDRIAAANRNLLVTPFNMHRLLVTALTLACKYLDDRCYSNVHYAKVGGIPTAREMNRLEIQYLKYLDFRLHVRFEDYKKKLTSLMDATPPQSPTSVMYHTSPVTTACPSPTSVSPMERPPLPVERTLDFEGSKSLRRMVDDNPSVDVTVEPSYPPHPAKPLDPYAAAQHHHHRQHHHHHHHHHRQHHQHQPMQRMKQDKWVQWNNSPTAPPQRPKPKRASRHNSRVSSLDPRFYRASHPSAMPMRYAECAP